MKRPLEVLAVGFVLGELFRLAGIRGLFLVVLCCPLLFFLWKWRAGQRRAILTVLTGALLGALCLHAAMLPGTEEQKLDRLTGAFAEYRGRIDAIEARGAGVRLRSGALYLSIVGEIGPSLQVGQTIVASGSLQEIAAPTNPGEFDYRSYCRARGVTHSMQVRRYRAEGRADPLGEGLRRLRSAAAEKLKNHCPREVSGYLNALLLGDKQELSEDFYARFRRNGLAHLLAISGLHTGFLGLALYRLLRRMGAGLWSSALFSALFLGLYALLTGADTGVLRSGLMLGLGFLALCLGRSYDLRSAASLALFLLLLRAPLQLFQCGFQLSFLAVFAIGGPGQALVRRYAAKRRYLAALLQSLTVFFVTLPAIAYWFFSLPPYGIVLNLVLIPMTGFMLFLGLLALAAASLLPPLAALPAFFLELGLAFQNALCSLAERLPLHRILIGRPRLWQLFLYSLFLCLCLALLLGKVPKFGKAALKPLRRALTLTAALAAALSLLPLRSQVPRIWLLDIGQGDAIVIEQGSRCITIDGGSTSRPDCGKRILEPFLMSRALGTVDAAFLTHADLDHTNGLSYLASKGSGILVKRVILNPAAETDAHYAKLMAALRENPETELCFMGAGDVYGNFTCLWPRRDALPDTVNEQSLILLFRANGIRCLFTGDAGTESEEKLLSELNTPGHEAERAALSELFLLKVGHHGSRSASSEAFLELLSPDCALISCGRGNSYGHPHAEAMERLHRHAGQVHSTAEEGALSVELHTAGQSGSLKEGKKESEKN